MIYTAKGKCECKPYTIIKLEIISYLFNTIVLTTSNDPFVLSLMQYCP